MARVFADRMFVLFVNNNGFVGKNDSIVLDVMDAQYFDSREEAEKHRSELYGNKRDEFQNRISILEWL